MNKTLEESIREQCKSLIGSWKNVNLRTYNSNYDVKSVHERKNWSGRLIDFIKWRTPLVRFFSYEWRLCGLDKCSYIWFLYNCDTGNDYYKIRNGRLYRRELLQNPYHMFVINIPIMEPVKFTCVDLTTSENKDDE